MTTAPAADAIAPSIPEIAKRIGDVRLRIVATNSLEQVYSFRGEYGRTVELATENLAALPEAEWGPDYFRDAAPPPIHDRFWLLLSLGYSALGSYNCTTKGSWGTARSPLERAVAAAQTGNVAIVLSLAVTTSTWVLAELGEESEALARLREGEQLLERQVARGLGGGAGTSLLTIAESCGMRPLVAHCLLSRGKLYRRWRKHKKAREDIVSATAMYRDMGMMNYLEQAEAELLQRQ